MNAEHRQILREKRLVLERTIKFDKTLINYLRQYKLFNQFMWEDIKSISDVLDLLPTRGPKAFESFIEILKKAKYVDEVDFLEKSKLSVSVLSFDSSLYYKMSLNSLGYLGYCLIINNVEFEKKIHHEKKDLNRYGSVKDAESLYDFFKRIKFDVAIETNLEAEIMKKTIEQFSKRDSVASLILIILTHGGQKDNKDFVYGTDWNYIYKEDIYDYFSNDKLHLQQKPKIFIFNACRVEGRDYSVSKTLPKQSLDAAPPIMLTTHSDILIINSCLPDQPSVLDHEEGSFFCSTLVSVLNEYHEVYDLETMIKFVNERLEKKVSWEYGVVQAAQLDSRGWKKSIMLRPSD